MSKERIFSKPLKEYLCMSDIELSEVAAAAGISTQDFKSLIINAQSQKETEALKKKDEMQTAKMEAQKYIKLQPSLRARLKELQASRSDIERATQLASEAYALLDERTYDEGFSSEHLLYSLFLKSEVIKARNRFYELAEGRTEHEILTIITQEQEKAGNNSLNIPELHKAILDCVDELRNILEIFSREFKMEHSDSHRGSDSYGSAETFNANTVSGYVKNPRPRRVNDELEGW